MRTTIIRALLVLFAVAFVAVTPASAAERRIAFVVGEKGYAAGELATAADDAGLIAQTLQAAGFDVIGARDLDAEILRKSYAEFLRRVADAGPDAVAFVYLAGYGLQHGNETYYVPIGADVSRDADIPLAAIRLGDLTGPLDALAAKARFVVLDAAYELPFQPMGPPLARGLALVSPHAGSLVATNAAPGTVAVPATGGYGLYAKSLAAELRAGGLSPDEIFARVRLRVTAASRGAEVPWDASKVDPAFRVFVRDADAPPPAASPAQLADLQTRPIGELPVDRAFNAAVARDTIAAYSAFLVAYPSNPLARRIHLLLAVRREAATWAETVAADDADAYWSYLARYPHGPHEAAAHARLEGLAAPPRPPAGFAPIAYEVAPPPPAELPLVDASAIAFDVPPPPPPDYWLPPEPAAFADLPPPPAPQEPYLLPVPVFVPLPDYVDPPVFVILPLGNYFYDPRGLPPGRPHHRIHQRMREGDEHRRAAGAMAAGVAEVALPAAALARQAALARRGVGETPAEMRGAPRSPDELGRHALPGAGGRPLPPLEAGRPGRAPGAGPVPRNEGERRQFERERAQAVHKLEEDSRRQRDLVRQEVERRRTAPGAAPFTPGAGAPRPGSRPPSPMRPQPDIPRMVRPQMPPPQMRQPAPVYRPPPPRIVVSPRPGGFGGGRPGGFAPPVRPAAPMVRPVAPVGRPFR